MMKILLFCIMIISLSSTAFAGEKEELQLKQALFQERMIRLQAEFAITQGQAKEVDTQLKAIIAKEEAAKKDENK